MRKKGRVNKEFHDYWRCLNADQRKKLAKFAGTSIKYLQQFSTGHAVLSAELAGRLAASTKRIPLKVPTPHGEIETLFERGDLCETCAGCEHYQLRNF